MRVVVAAAVAVLALAGPAHAGFGLKELLDSRLDPDRDYKTIRTENFDVHYPAELEPVARRIAAVAERARRKVVRRFGSAPGRTHIVVVHRSDETHIFTFVHPHRQIFYDVALPHAGIGLNDYADWHDWLITHEYAHVAHLEARRGAYADFAALLGAWVRPNMTSPPWLKEGLAVLAETELTGKGRGRGSTDRMILRAATAEGRLRDPEFASLDTIANFDAKSWPWTVRPYVFGYEMVRELSRLRGPDAIARIVDAGARAGPYQLDAALGAIGIRGASALWESTLAAIERDARAEIEAIRRDPVTALDYLTDDGYLHHGLAVSPNGKWLVATHETPHEETAIVRLDLDGDRVGRPRRMVSRSTGYQSSFSASSRFLAFDQTGRAGRHYLVSDIYIHDFKTGRLVTASPIMRAREPDVHPDGKHVAFVVNRGGRNQLVVTDTAWENETVLIDDVGYRRLSGPRFSPDGSRLVVSVHDDRTGGEELWLVGDGTRRVLVSDGAQNRSPSWTADGSRVVYASDASGVFNIHAVEVSTGRRYRLTNLIGGAFHPVVDPAMRWVYVSSYRSHGYDLARFRFDPSAWVELPVAAPPADVAATPLDVESSAVPAADYSAWRYLAPQYLLPSVVLRPGSYQVGGRLGAVDPLFFHHWELALRYDSATDLPAGKLSYFHGARPWAVDAAVSHDSVAISDDETLRSLVAIGHLNIPLSDVGTYVHLRPGLVAERVDFTGATHYAGAVLGLRYDTTFRQIGQSFPESGLLVDLEARELAAVRDDGVGSTTSVSGHVAWHRGLGARRQALHLGLAGGAVLLGRDDPNAVFTGGGVRSFPSEPTSPFVLWGYPPNALIGQTLGIASAHYTVELVDIQRGPGAVPLALGRLSAGVRGQLAYSDDLEPAPDLDRGVPWSAGVELYQELVAGYLFGFTAGLGLHRGASRFGGETQLVFTLTAGE